ncbi:MAG: hypothetical protein V6Z86_08440 [Hyphomicrobiales bacterium]
MAKLKSFAPVARLKTGASGLKSRDRFRSSLMARAAFERLLMVAVIIAGLWLGVAWSVALP